MPHLTEEVVVGISDGLHLRRAAQIVALAQQFSAEIQLSLPDADPADAKSMIALTALGAGHGAILKLTADGDDAQQAMTSLLELFGSNFAAPD